MNCTTWCSIFGPHEVNSFRDSDSQRERERVENIEIQIENLRDSKPRLQVTKIRDRRFNDDVSRSKFIASKRRMINE
jgi:hypothetical protein